MIDVRRVTFQELCDDPKFHDLMAEYAAECGINGMPPPTAKFETYRQFEKAYLLSCYGAFDKDGLVGIVFVLLTNLIHYGGCQTAVTESFFVFADKRGTGAGMLLLRRAEQFAKEVGSPVLLVNALHDSDLSAVAPKLGYKQTSDVFFKGFK